MLTEEEKEELTECLLAIAGNAMEAKESADLAMPFLNDREHLVIRLALRSVKCHMDNIITLINGLE